jgi:putative FmdB family regulatory protein
MPTYSYACDACGHAFEKEQRITEDPIKKCPKCGKNKARRMIAGAAGFILKGGGWYADLYSSKRPDSGSKSESSDSSSTSESSTETKTADKPDKAEKPAKKEAPAKSESKPKKKAAKD